MTYKTLKQAVASGSDFLAEDLENVEKDGSSAVIKITGIRTQETNDETKKCSCAAQLTIERKNPLTGKRSSSEMAFTYAAQYSDDNSQVYVEAYGL